MVGITVKNYKEFSVQWVRRVIKESIKAQFWRCLAIIQDYKETVYPHCCDNNLAAGVEHWAHN